MAIDTAAKRRSVAGLLLPFLVVGVTPTATPDVAWRQSAAWSYEWIEAAAPAVSVDPYTLCHEAIVLRYPASPALVCRYPVNATVVCRYPPNPSLTLRC